jgi:hypothetical protein
MPLRVSHDATIIPEVNKETLQRFPSPYSPPVLRMTSLSLLVDLGNLSDVVFARTRRGTKARVRAIPQLRGVRTTQLVHLANWRLMVDSNLDTDSMTTRDLKKKFVFTVNSPE